MKFLEILIPFLTQQGKSFFDSNAQSMTKQIANNARKFSILLALTIIFISLFCIGFSMAYTAVINSIQSTSGDWQWAGIIGGAALSLVSSGGLFYSLGEKRWTKAMQADAEDDEEQKQSGPSPIEGAFAVLILEVTNEMRARRAAKKAAESESPSSNAS